MKKFILMSSIFLTFSSGAKADSLAGIFVEPMITFERGRGDVNFPAPFRSAETELDGLGVGARVGMHVYESIFIAADARYSIPNFKDDRLNQDIDASAWNLGPIVGVQMPTIVGLRLWAGWVVAGEVDPDRSQGVDEIFKSGQGYRVGAGLKVAVVSLNIEYQKINYSETELEEVGVFSTDSTRSDVEFDNDSVVLSVSFPYSI